MLLHNTALARHDKTTTATGNVSPTVVAMLAVFVVLNLL
jgi:hypothetical protein